MGKKPENEYFQAFCFNRVICTKSKKWTMRMSQCTEQSIQAIGTDQYIGCLSLKEESKSIRLDAHAKMIMQPR